MQLVDYNFEEDVVNAIEEYERDKNPSLNGIIEEFIKGVLYEAGYLQITLNEDEIFTPKELNKIDKFIIKPRKDRAQIKFDDLNFGTFDKNIVDNIIYKLAHLSDEDFIKYSKTYCQKNFNYNSKEYHDFILNWLEDDSLVPVKQNIIKKVTFPSKPDLVQFSLQELMICNLNSKKYTSEVIDDVYSFLNKFSKPQLEKIIKMRKKTKINSDKFILRLMKNPERVNNIIEDK